LGHKVHPNAFRLGVFRPWEANWFANPKDYTKMLHEDLEMRRVILARLRNAGIAKIETERSSIQEIKQPELDAQLVAENIASQIERRISYKRAMKQAILRTMRSGAKGVRIYCGGRLRGAEMARREWDREGRVPLHTLRANIDFGRATANTTFGAIGVKCWIYKDVAAPLRKQPVAAEATAPIAEIAPQPELADVLAESQAAAALAAAAPVATPEPEVVTATPAPRRVRTTTTPTTTTAAKPAAKPKAEPKAKAAPKTETKAAAPKAKAETKAPAKKATTAKKTKS
jgi:small subunit ribosomal protein S3